MSTRRLHDCCPAMFVDVAKNHESLVCVTSIHFQHSTKRSKLFCMYFCFDGLMQGSKEGWFSKTGIRKEKIRLCFEKKNETGKLKQ